MPKRFPEKVALVELIFQIGAENWNEQLKSHPIP